jgi:hypothetical protein
MYASRERTQALQFLVGGNTSGGSNTQQMEQESVSQLIRTPSRNKLRYSGMNIGNYAPCEEVHTVIQFFLNGRHSPPLEFHYQLTKSIWWWHNGSAARQKMPDDDCTCQPSMSQVTEPFHWELLDHPPCSSDLIPSDYSMVMASEATLGNSIIPQ